MFSPRSIFLKHFGPFSKTKSLNSPSSTSFYRRHVKQSTKVLWKLKLISESQSIKCVPSLSLSHLSTANTYLTAFAQVHSTMYITLPNSRCIFDNLALQPSVERPSKWGPKTSSKIYRVHWFLFAPLKWKKKINWWWAEQEKWKLHDFSARIFP